MNASRRSIAAIAALLFAGLVFAPAASADLFSPESGGSPNADTVDSLYWVTMAIGLFVAVSVEGLLFYTLFKFRASKGAVAKQVRGNTRLEIAWTVAAAVIVVILAGYTYSKLDEIIDPPASIARGVDESAAPMTDKGKLNVCVDGFQFGWRFTYQEKCTDTHKRNTSKNPRPQDKLYSFEELVVPAGVTVTIGISSLDVNHAWWIPKLGGKRDATRGYIIDSWFRVPVKFGEKPGGTVFYGQCAELCGRGHANMTARVRALSIPEFNAWAKRKRAEIAAADAAIPGLAKKLRVTAE